MNRTVQHDMPENNEIEQAIRELLANGAVYRTKEARDILAKTFTLSDEQRDRPYPSGGTVFHHMCNDAIQSLCWKGILKKVSRGCYRIKPGIR